LEQDASFVIVTVKDWQVWQCGYFVGLKEDANDN